LVGNEISSTEVEGFGSGNYKLSNVKVKIYDITIPTDSGAGDLSYIWDRVGLTLKNPEMVNWEWKGNRFEKLASAGEIQQIQNGGAQFNLDYSMMTELAAQADVERIPNVGFGVIDFDYIRTDDEGNPTGEFGSKEYRIGERTELGFPTLCGPKTMNDFVASASTLGAQTVVKIIRPFVEAKGGSNIGIETSTGEKLFGEKTVIVPSETGTGGQFLTDEELEGIKSFTDRDDFFENLKRNVVIDPFPSETFFGTNWQTTPDRSGVYFIQEDITLSESEMVDLDESKTFIIEDGANLTITKNFRTTTNGLAAFIVRDGNIIIDSGDGKTDGVEEIEGIFIAENGYIASTGKSYQQLRVSGALMGNAADLLTNRKFIGLDPDSKLEPSVKITFDLRLLDQTPPALEGFLGEGWQQE